MTDHKPFKRSIVVTGASTGIGYACAVRLAAGGFQVFAGVRTEAACLQLGAVSGVTPVILDVTSGDDVDALAERLSHDSPDGIWGLINNAGIAVAGPLECVTTEDLDAVLSVNVSGLLRVSQGLLPLLKKAQGRIINMGSISGSAPLPCTGAYAASKAAVAVLSDVLSMELRSEGVGVALIEAGRIDTPIWSKAAATVPATGTSSETLERFQAGLLRGGGLKPAAVAEVVYQAFLARKMKRRYIVGPDAVRLSRWRILPAFLRERWMLQRCGLAEVSERSSETQR